LIVNIRSEIGLVNIMSSEHKDQCQRISLTAVDTAMNFVSIVITWQNSKSIFIFIFLFFFFWTHYIRKKCRKHHMIISHVTVT